MAGLELHMAGDPAGTRILQAMTPVNWAKKWQEAAPIAKGKLLDAAAMAQERIEGVPNFDAAQFPAWGMLTGDMATRAIMEEAGVSSELARRYTLTSEPVTRPIESIVNIQRTGGPLMQMLLPFARTPGNIVEQSLARTPIIGPMVQRAVPELAYPAEVQAQQQILGAAVPTIAGGAGYLSPEESDAGSAVTGRTLRSFISNVFGPYSGLATVGFGVGKALQQPGRKLGDVAFRAGTEALQTLPLPTSDIPTSGMRTLRQLLNLEAPTQVPSGVPGAGLINPVLKERGQRNAAARTTRRRRRERE